jgi:hypothetical protein
MEVTYKGKPIRIAADFSTQMKHKRVMGRHISGPERKQVSTYTDLSSKTILPNLRKN